MIAGRRLFCLLPLVCTLSLFQEASFARAGIFTVRKEDSHVGFSVYKWLVFKEEGRFKDFEGTIYYDPENPVKTRIEFTIHAASVDSRNEGRDRALRSREFFDVENHPTLGFKSVEVRPMGKDSLLVEGDLTMRGVTKRVTVPVKALGTHHVKSVGLLAGFEAAFVVNREDFGIGGQRTSIGSEVTIQLLIGAASQETRANR